MLTINLEYDPNALAAPQSFRNGVDAAADILEAAIYNPITVNIEVGYGDYDYGGPSYTPLTADESLGGVNSGINVSYPALRAALAADETSPADAQAVASLPATLTLAGQSDFYITTAEAKALGVLPATDPAIDGYVGFPPSFTGDDLIDAGIVEMLHAMGLLNGGYVLSLFQYSSPGVHVVLSATSTTPAYFSIDGGNINLANYDVSFDSTLFENLSSDPLNAPDTGSTVLTPLDLDEISTLGFDVSGPTTIVGDMILRQGVTGDYEIYDIANNQILGAHALGQVGTEWVVAGLGDFDGADTTDMILRDSITGAFEVYDISNNKITAKASLGEVGLEWQVAGFGDFSGNPNETDMMLRNINTGVFELYDIQNNQIRSASAIGQVGFEWQVAGFGDFSSNPDETDMLLRNVNTGTFEVYDVSNSRLTSASGLGQVGLEWQVAGFGDFSSNLTETDMILRNVKTGVFELYDIQNNQVTSASTIGQVGLEWQIAGFGDFSGNPNETDMVLRNTQTGAFEVYDIASNQLAGAASLGQVGLEWQVGGFAPDPFTIVS